MSHLCVVDHPATGPLPSCLITDLGEGRVDLSLIRRVYSPAALSDAVSRIQSRLATDVGRWFQETGGFNPEKGRIPDDAAIEAGWQNQFILPSRGDLRLFNDGLFYHRISPFERSRPRATFGCFVGLSKEHRRLLRWDRARGRSTNRP